MHVLIIPSWYPSYAAELKGTFFREQAIALRRHGCKVGVIYPALRSLRNWRSVFTSPRGIGAEQDEGVETYRFWGTNWSSRFDPPASEHFVWRVRQLYQRYVADQGAPDIIHAHSLLYAGCAAADLHRRYAMPFVVTEHRSIFQSGLVSARGVRLARNAASFAARKLAVSAELATLLNERLGHEGSRWVELPNMVNPTFTDFEVPPKSASERFEFLNVAMMDENKGQDALLRAFARLSKTHPGARLTIGGDGRDRGKLERLARELGVADKVMFPGLLSREEVLRRMAMTDAFVLSSRFETFGVVVIEALALGKPVIATRCGGPNSILREEDGILVPVDSVESLTAAMSRFVEKTRAYDAAEIRRSCIQRYSEHAVTTRLKQIYAEVVPTSTAPVHSQKAPVPCNS